MKMFNFNLFKKFNLLLFSFVIIFSVNAQDEGNPYPNERIPVAPDIDNLQRAIDVKAGMYNGAATISIPIQTVKGFNYTDNISISYTTTGHKVNEIASWVGLGWNLKVGGSISRTINGVADEIDDQGYLNLNDIGYKPSNLWDAYYYDGDISDNDHYRMKDIATNFYDSGSDLYSFNFGPYSGSFVFDENGNPVFLDYQPFEVEWNFSDFGNNHAKQFIITTQDGYKYVFGKTLSTNQEAVVDVTINISPGASAVPKNYLSTWHLVEVYDFNNRLVCELDYNEVSLDYKYNYREYIKCQEIGGEGSSVGIPNNGQCQTIHNVNINSAIQSWVLKEITTDYDSITFQSSIREDLNGGYRLDRLEIYNNVNNVMNFNKAFNFDYLYRKKNEYENDYDDKRLQLNYIAEVGKNNEKLPPYEFEYNSLELPSRNSFKIDWFGFYNGSVKTGVVPYNYDYITGSIVLNSNTDRNPNFNYSVANILEKVNYPTGATLVFEYEPNINTDYSEHTIEKQFNKIISINTGPGDLYIDEEESGEKYFGMYFPDDSYDRKILYSVSLMPVDQYGDCNPGPGSAWIPSAIINNITYATTVGQCETETGEITANGDFYNVTVKVYRPDDYYQMTESSLVEFRWKQKIKTTQINYDELGGIRLAKKILYDGKGNTNYVEYKYDNSVNVIQRRIYESSVANFSFETFGYSIIYDLHFNSDFYKPLGVNMATPVMYKKVTEKYGLDGIDGMKINYFQLRSAPPGSTTGIKFFNKKDHGKLLATKIYSYNNFLNTYEIREIETFNYSIQSFDKIYFIAARERFSDVFMVGGGSFADNQVMRDAVIDVEKETFMPVWINLEQKTTIKYDPEDQSKYSTVTTNYSQYDPVSGKPAVITIVDGIDETVIHKSFLHQFTEFNSDIAKDPLVEQIVSKNSFVVNGFFNKYQRSTELNHLQFDKSFKLDMVNPIALADFDFSTANGAKSDDYFEDISFNNYNDYNLPTDYKIKNSKDHAIIYGYGDKIPIAYIGNATAEECGYTGFESDDCSEWDRTLSHPSVVSQIAYTGSKSILVGGLVDQLGPNKLFEVDEQNGKYIFSFWAKAQSNYIVNSGISTVQLKDNVNGTVVDAWGEYIIMNGNEWTYNEFVIDNEEIDVNIFVFVELSNGSSTPNIGFYVDDIRFYPADATFQNISYNENSRVNAIQDLSSNTQIFEYDDLQRLKQVSNTQQKIVKTANYNYQDFDFLFSPLLPKPGQSVTFSINTELYGNPSNVTWNINGNTFSGEEVSASFGDIGKYQISCAATIDGEIYNKSKEISIDAPFTIISEIEGDGIYYTNNAPRLKLKISSYYSIETITIDWGDGNSDVFTGDIGDPYFSTTHGYETSETYDINIEVVDVRGKIRNDMARVIIHPQYFHSDFHYYFDQSIPFNANVTPMDINDNYTYHWEFNENVLDDVVITNLYSNSEEQEQSFVYETSEINEGFSIKLTVTDQFQNSKSTVKNFHLYHVGIGYHFDELRSNLNWIPLGNPISGENLFDDQTYGYHLKLTSSALLPEHYSAGSATFSVVCYGVMDNGTEKSFIINELLNANQNFEHDFDAKDLFNTVDEKVESIYFMITVSQVINVDDGNSWIETKNLQLGDEISSQFEIGYND